MGVSACSTMRKGSDKWQQNRLQPVSHTCWKSSYLEKKLLPGRPDLKLTLFPLHIVAEARIAYFYVSERQGILGSLEVIQVTFPRIIDEPPRLVPSQRPLAGQFVQVAAQLGGLLLCVLHIGHIHGLGGGDPQRCAGARLAAILLFVHLSSNFLLRAAQRMPTAVSMHMTACLPGQGSTGDVVYFKVARARVCVCTRVCDVGASLGGGVWQDEGDEGVNLSQDATHENLFGQNNICSAFGKVCFVFSPNNH